MNWFILALLCTLGWGFADLFYKKGTDDKDSDSQYKITVFVGLVMGITAVVLIPFSETIKGPIEFFDGAIKYSPASLCYIISMIIGYAGLRYLELSIVSPLQNASGAFSMIVMLIFFISTGRISSISDEYSILDYIGTAIIIAGSVALSIVENKLAHKEAFGEQDDKEKKYRIGALALLFPLAYCLFDTIGTAADGIILDEETGLGLGEVDVLILYGFTFFLAALTSWLYMFIKNKKAYNPFNKKDMSSKGIAALCEECGQIFYVYAMAKKPVIAAPMIASYCVISVILSRLIIKEKLEKNQYACIFAVIIGIVVLGISEGLCYY